MGWPDRPDNWRNHARPAQKAYSDVANAISAFEPVIVYANSGQMENARRALQDAVDVEELPQDDAWLRDSGPTFLVGGEKLVGVDWQFNGYGGDVLPSWKLDAGVAAEVLRRAKVKRIKADFVLEGGSIHVDGEGTLLTTEECLLHPNRNPGLSKAEIQQRLMDYTGATRVIWLPRGLLADEDTNGHVDNFACFSAPGKVLLAWPSVHDPEQLARSEEALKVLEGTLDAKGRKLEVTKLPLPPPLHYEPHEAIHEDTGAVDREAGGRLAASYINFYICNGAVICPAFGGVAAGTDAGAEKILSEAFPGRKVVVIDSAREILLGGGNIHCITQQQPAPCTSPMP